MADDAVHLPDIKHPLVLVTWVDHSSDDQWHGSIEEQIKRFDSGGPVHSVGWLIHEDEKRLLLCQNVSPADGHYCMTMEIFKGLIENVTRLDEPTH
jgi:hypothetical protein